MKKTKLLLLAFIVSLIATNARAQSAFSIEEAVDYAIKNHSSVKNSLVGMQDAELQIKEIKYSGMPQINGQFGYTYNAIVPTQLIDAKNFNPEAAEGEVDSQWRMKN